MTVFEQQNLKDLRQAGYVQITNGEAAQALIIFIQQNFSHEFPYGLKLILGVGFHGTSNYILHAVPQIVKLFQDEIQTRLEVHKKYVNNFTTALDTLR
ncbi:MAG: hypothetical protein ACW97P_12435 [Candidatus Hodarchaeales archaeon]|jgi:hypothetical protein